MKKILFPLLASLALCLAGCLVPSLNPLYTDKDLVFDPALAGAWGKAEDPDRWVFERERGQAYTWTIRDKESTNEFRAHLVKLGEHRFLDAMLVRTQDEWKGIGRTAVVVRPAHVFFKVELSSTNLLLRALSTEWLDQFLKENPTAIAHERIHEPDNAKEGRVMLTASTADLQRFILQHVGTPKAFTEGDDMPRLDGAAKVSAP